MPETGSCILLVGFNGTAEVGLTTRLLTRFGAVSSFREAAVSRGRIGVSVAAATGALPKFEAVLAGRLGVALVE